MIDSMTKWLPGWKRKGWKTAAGQPVKNQDLLTALEARGQAPRGGALALGARGTRPARPSATRRSTTAPTSSRWRPPPRPARPARRGAARRRRPRGASARRASPAPRRRGDRRCAPRRPAARRSRRSSALRDELEHAQLALGQARRVRAGLRAREPRGSARRTRAAARGRVSAAGSARSPSRTVSASISASRSPRVVERQRCLVRIVRRRGAGRLPHPGPRQIARELVARTGPAGAAAARRRRAAATSGAAVQPRPLGVGDARVGEPDQQPLGAGALPRAGQASRPAAGSPRRASSRPYHGIEVDVGNPVVVDDLEQPAQARRAPRPSGRGGSARRSGACAGRRRASRSRARA